MHEGLAQKLITDGEKRIFIFILKTFAFYCVAFFCPFVHLQEDLVHLRTTLSDGTLIKSTSV